MHKIKFNKYSSKYNILIGGYEEIFELSKKYDFLSDDVQEYLYKFIIDVFNDKDKCNNYNLFVKYIFNSDRYDCNIW
jgi:hypothetical protein